jgi:hypothetical protein
MHIYLIVYITFITAVYLLGAIVFKRSSERLVSVLGALAGSIALLYVLGLLH